ncbi:FliH/SctL family protein [Athalassotoga saccharophila]|uniref:FliH/SctL family protein n=1 Tax=Athalassotoga saccharophila TaxID=1441386 RepID=UPI00137A654E|nr:FliH/SctL family protein [Athalassotoga saccharophila]BBJ27828.1 flagellar export assembly protein [Athalassotoga saccharophila]
MSEIIKKPPVFEDKIKIGYQEKKQEEKVDPLEEAEKRSKFILESAKKEYERILSSAIAKSKEIKEDAYNQGYKAGYEKSLEEWKKKFLELDSFIEKVKKSIDQSVDDITPYLLELSISVVREIVLSEVDPSSISKKIERVMQMVKSSKNVKLYVPPNLPEEILEDLKHRSIEVIVDPAFGPDDLRAEVDFGVMDLRVDSQLNAFEDLMRKSFGVNGGKNG